MTATCKSPKNEGTQRKLATTKRLYYSHCEA